MTNKDKRAGSRSEHAKGATSKDDNRDNSAITDAERIGPKEVFDSSKYDAMSDMTKGSNLETKNVETLSDTGRATNDLRSEEIKNGLITKPSKEREQTPAISDGTTATDTSRITPMTFEERARTIREVNEEKSHQQSSSSSYSGLSKDSPYQYRKEDKFVLYLNLLLSIENAAIERLHTRIQQSLLPELREQLVHHLEETREQKSRLIALIQGLGGEATNERAELPIYSQPKVLSDALNASTIAPEEQELKTMENDALIEYSEILGYNTVIQMATKMNIGEAVMPLRQNLQEEEEMLAWMRANLPSNFVKLWSRIEQVGLVQ
jgi:ferritin-like metal-binding protein YciE